MVTVPAPSGNPLFGDNRNKLGTNPFQPQNRRCVATKPKSQHHREKYFYLMGKLLPIGKTNEIKTQGIKFCACHPEQQSTRPGFAGLAHNANNLVHPGLPEIKDFNTLVGAHCFKPFAFCVRCAIRTTKSMRPGPQGPGLSIWSDFG